MQHWHKKRAVLQFSQTATTLDSSGRYIEEAGTPRSLYEGSTLIMVVTKRIYLKLQEIYKKCGPINYAPFNQSVGL